MSGNLYRFIENKYVTPKLAKCSAHSFTFTFQLGKNYIVALGASAGGQKALEEFFDNTLVDAISYVIVTHLQPDFKSYLTQIIGKHSALQVCEAENNMLVEPNKVYVMPENTTMTIEDNRLKLKKRDLALPLNHAIDIFFTSLSQQKEIDTIAIIFSGMGRDGRKGAEAIAESGGLIIVQDPLTAQHPSMPAHVMKGRYADLILSPKDMPQHIRDYVEA